MPQLPYLRILQRPGLLGGVLFATTMGLAVAIAYQAVRAAASHRAAAEASLKHHATIAAWRYTREARSWLMYGMDQAGNQLGREFSALDTLPGPDVLIKVLALKECDCMTAAFGRTFFRVVNDSAPRIVSIGEPLSERSKDSLVVLAMQSMTNTITRRNRYSWRMLAPGQPRLSRATDVALLWKIADSNKRNRAIYGMIVEEAQLRRPLGESLKNSQFFPPSLVPPASADSLVHIEVSGPNGQPVFESGPTTRLFVGTDTIGAYYGDLTVTAAIAPAAARLLLDGASLRRAHQ